MGAGGEPRDIGAHGGGEDEQWHQHGQVHSCEPPVAGGDQNWGDVNAMHAKKEKAKVAKKATVMENVGIAENGDTLEENVLNI